MRILKTLFALAFIAAAAVSTVRAAESRSEAVSGSWPAITVTGGVRFFSPSGADFKTVYGSGILAGAEVRVRIAGRFELSLEAERFKKDGMMTVTNEPTTIKMTPLTVLAVFHVLSGGLRPYVGAGVSTLSYRENNHLGTATGSGTGYAVCGGIIARGKLLGVDARVKYASIKDERGGESIEFGGLTFGLGIGFFF